MTNLTKTPAWKSLAIGDPWTFIGIGDGINPDDIVVHEWSAEIGPLAFRATRIEANAVETVFIGKYSGPPPGTTDAPVYVETIEGE